MSRRTLFTGVCLLPKSSAMWMFTLDVMRVCVPFWTMPGAVRPRGPFQATYQAYSLACIGALAAASCAVCSASAGGFMAWGEHVTGCTFLVMGQIVKTWSVVTKSSCRRLRSAKSSVYVCPCPSSLAL